VSRPPHTLDELARVSLALRNLLEQRERIAAGAPPDQAAIDALTGDDRGPAVYDLTAIWRASLEDPDCRHISQGLGKTSPQARRYMSPRRYVNGWPHMIDAIAEPGGGRILVDRNAAFDYCQRADARVMCASIDRMIEQDKAAAKADPIGHAVASARGGGFAMMFARVDAAHLGLTDDQFNEAVMERAKREAASLDGYAAEKLVSEVRRALESGPRVVFLDEK